MKTICVLNGMDKEIGRIVLRDGLIEFSGATAGLSDLRVRDVASGKSVSSQDDPTAWFANALQLGNPYYRIIYESPPVKANPYHEAMGRFAHAGARGGEGAPTPRPETLAVAKAFVAPNGLIRSGMPVTIVITPEGTKAIVLKFNPHHDAQGRFASGGVSSESPTVSASARAFGATQAFKKFGAQVNPNAIDASQGDHYLREIVREQGFDGTPHVVDDLNEYVKAGELEVFRGVATHKMAEQYRTGDYYAGRGIQGSGIYTVERFHQSWASRRPEDSGAEFAKQFGPSVLHMTIRQGARVISHDALVKRWLKDKERNVDPPAQFYDIGRYAAAKGYDAIHCKQQGFYVVLNRTATRVEAQDYVKANRQ